MDVLTRLRPHALRPQKHQAKRQEERGTEPIVAADDLKPRWYGKSLRVRQTCREKQRSHACSAPTERATSGLMPAEVGQEKPD